VAVFVCGGFGMWRFWCVAVLVCGGSGMWRFWFCGGSSRTRVMVVTYAYYEVPIRYNPVLCFTCTITESFKITDVPERYTVQLGFRLNYD